MLAVGTTGRAACRVESANTAPNMGSGDLAVFATPSMIALMESAASKSVLPLLNPGETTVGTHMDVTHTSATPVGMEIRAESRLEEIDGEVYQIFIGSGADRQRRVHFVRTMFCGMPTECQGNSE